MPLLTLFASAFLAATLLPAQSEAVLAALLLGERHAVWLLLLVATVGNTLGAWVNWAIGRGIERYRGRRWFPVSERNLERAQRLYGRFGRWSLLFSWAPLVGDALTLVAGVMREPWWRFLLLVALAKGGRYLVLAGLVLGWMGAGR
ncbi:YqaA family protein [Stutzerimonas azotifigens]|uniref:YqaA family protein n=1 Tax=Stutzerimonas azotifigens TaxID=291995 RepID=UPI00042158BB|nr:YqaA family protein [Stutzerimonas azotifigens]